MSILSELEALVNSAMETMGGAAVMSGVRCEGGVGGGDSELGGEGEGMSGDRWPTPSPGDIVFQSSTSRYFCGEGRSNSPFGEPQFNFLHKNLSFTECVYKSEVYTFSNGDSIHVDNGGIAGTCI